MGLLKLFWQKLNFNFDFHVIEIKLVYLMNQILKSFKTIPSILIFCVTFNFHGNEHRFTKTRDQEHIKVSFKNRHHSRISTTNVKSFRYKIQRQVQRADVLRENLRRSAVVVEVLSYPPYNSPFWIYAAKKSAGFKCSRALIPISSPLHPPRARGGLKAPR